MLGDQVRKKMIKINGDNNISSFEKVKPMETLDIAQYNCLSDLHNREIKKIVSFHNDAPRETFKNLITCLEKLGEETDSKRQFLIFLEEYIKGHLEEILYFFQLCSKPVLANIVSLYETLGELRFWGIYEDENLKIDDKCKLYLLFAELISKSKEYDIINDNKPSLHRIGGASSSSISSNSSINSRDNSAHSITSSSEENKCGEDISVSNSESSIGSILLKKDNVFDILLRNLLQHTLELKPYNVMELYKLVTERRHRCNLCNTIDNGLDILNYGLPEKEKDYFESLESRNIWKNPTCRDFFEFKKAEPLNKFMYETHKEWEEATKKRDAKLLHQDGYNIFYNDQAIDLKAICLNCLKDVHTFIAEAGNDKEHNHLFDTPDGKRKQIMLKNFEYSREKEKWWKAVGRYTIQWQLTFTALKKCVNQLRLFEREQLRQALLKERNQKKKNLN